MKMMTKVSGKQDWIKEESKVRVEKCLLPSYKKDQEENGARAPAYRAKITYMTYLFEGEIKTLKCRLPSNL